MLIQQFAIHIIPDIEIISYAAYGFNTINSKYFEILMENHFALGAVWDLR